VTVLNSFPGFWSNVGAGLLCMLVGAALGSVGIWLRRRKIVPQVDISVRRIDDPSLDEIIVPRVLIVIYSGIYPPPNPRLSSEEKRREDELFAKRVADCDHAALELSFDTLSIGHTIRAIDQYKRTLQKVVLITTTTSKVSVPLLRAYARDVLGFTQPIDDSDRYSLNPDNDVQVTLTAYEKTKLIFRDLRRANLYDSLHTLVDATGGTRALQTGVLLACLGRDQNIHLIGSKYGTDGRPIPGQSFPMIIHFAPHLRRESDS
jgi:hypothetical protein